MIELSTPNGALLSRSDRHNLRHPDVEALQALLAAHGHDAPQSGEFDAGTEAALKEFQRAHRLKPSGATNLPTWNALRALPEPASEPEPAPVTRVTEDARDFDREITEDDDEGGSEEE